MPGLFEALADSATIQHHLNDPQSGLASPYAALKAAAALKNPLPSYIQDAIATRSGLTRPEIAGLLGYVECRTAPTVAEIANLATVFARAALSEPMQDIFHNLQDEVGGKVPHVKMLLSSISEFSNRLGIPALGAFSLPMTKLFLRARRELDRPDLNPDQDGLAVLQAHYPNHPVLKTRIGLLGSTFDSSFFNTAGIVRYYLDLIPPNSDQYENAVTAACNRDLQNDHNLPALTGGLVRLAIREHSSASQDGVVGIYESTIRPFAGHFAQASFGHISAWPDAHIGEKGVECIHEADAVRHAVKFCALLAPDQLSTVFRQEAALVHARHDLACAFAERLKIARNRANPDDFIPIRPAQKTQGWWRNLWPQAA